MKKYNFDGFTLSLQLDDDGDWLAFLLELPNVSAFAARPEDAVRELEIAWNAVKQSYKKRGEMVPVAPSKKNYSGQFNVRIDKRLHRSLAMEAAQVGLSLNALVSQKLSMSTNPCTPE